VPKHARSRVYRPRHSIVRRRRQVRVASAAVIMATSAVGLLSYGGSPAPVVAAAPPQPPNGPAATVPHDTMRAEEAAAITADARKLVAGLDRAEMENANAIVAVGKQRGLPPRAMVIAVATAMQESNLYNTASSAVPASFSYPHQGNSVDHDSVGLFQQRVSQDWGSVAQLMDPATSAGLFYDRLVRVAGWQDMRLTAAAQAVQRSGFPNAYQKHEDRATQVVAALV
jgi:hypothetical protein